MTESLAEFEARTAARKQPRWVLFVVFVATFACLHFGYEAVRGTWLERMVIDEATVKPATRVIRAITPEVDVTADRHRLRATGGGLNILNGCEGTEVLFLLAAAFAAVPIGWRRKLSGLALGMLLVYLANQLRVVSLFYAFRSDRELFEMLHGLVAPTAIVLVAAGFFFAWTHRPERFHAPPDPA